MYKMENKIDNENKVVEMATKLPLHYKCREFFKPLNASWEYRQKKVFDSAKKNHNLFLKAVPVQDEKEIHLFASANIETFWCYYNDLGPSERVHYEIIKADKPCKAVIDLEWYSDIRHDKQDDKFEHIGTQLMDVFYKLDPDFDPHRIVNACSTRFLPDKNKWKNSYHFIFPIAFENVQVLKLFMHHYLDKNIIDLSIYTNNRAFRMIGSHKETDKSNTSLSLINHEWSYETFRDSLASFTEDYKNFITFDILKKKLGITSNITYSKPITETTNVEISSSLEEFIRNQIKDIEIIDRKDNLITLRNKNNRTCYITGENHVNNNAYLIISNDKIYYACHGKECSGKRKLLGVFNKNKWNKTRFSYKLYKDIILTVSNQERLEDMTKYKEGVLFVCSEMGTGKSFQMKELYLQVMEKHKKKHGSLLERYRIQHPRTCIVTTRVAFAHSMMSLFPTFKLYTDPDVEFLNDDIIIQYESLHRLFKNNAFDAFELLILDESESLLNNSICKATNGEHFTKNKRVFELLVDTSIQIYVSDAKMTDKSISVINKIIPEKPKRIILNKYKIKDKHILFHNNYDNWINQLKTFINTGKRIAITTSSFTEGEKIVETIFKTNEKLIGKWKFYHQGCDDKMMEDFQNINEVWSKLDYVIYTPKVTVGADFNMKHFDYIFSFAHALSCPVEISFQMIGRIRKPKTPYVHLFIKEIKQTTLPLSYKDIKQELLTRNGKLDELYGIIDTEYKRDGRYIMETMTDSWINDVYIYNQQEINLSKTDYVRRFFDIAKEKGWDMYMAEKSVAVFDNSTDDFYDAKAPKSSKQLYDSIDLEKFDHVKADKNRKYRMATSVQKMGLKKLYYDSNFPEIETKDSHEFYITMAKPTIHKIFKNALSLLSGESVQDIMYDDFRSNDYIELAKSNAPILLQINKILEILGVVSLLDTKTTFSTTDIEEKIEHISKCVENLKIVMHIRCRKAGKQSKLKELLYDLNNILFNWIGVKIIKIDDSRKQITVNRKKKEIYDYKLKYRNIYQDKDKKLSILDIVKKSTYI